MECCECAKSVCVEWLSFLAWNTDIVKNQDEDIGENAEHSPVYECAEVKYDNPKLRTHLDLSFQKLGHMAQLFLDHNIIAHPMITAACLAQFIAMTCAELELVHDDVTFRGNFAYRHVGWAISVEKIAG